MGERDEQYARYMKAKSLFESAQNNGDQFKIDKVTVAIPRLISK